MKIALSLVAWMAITLSVVADSIQITGLAQFSGSISLSVTPGLVSYFYGLTSAGGITNGSVPNGNGVAYKVRGDGAFVSLYQFPFLVNQEVPVGGFILATNGFLYGITQDGGANSKGTVFRMTTNGTYTLMHSFLNATDGGFPNPTLLQANDGFLYGMCSQGGSAEGTLFKCSLTGTFSTLHNFSGGAEGGQPYGTVIQTADGSLYGTCSAGGTDDSGSIFKCTLAGTCTAIYSFSASGATDGKEPRGDLLQISNGEMYGMTVNGGTSGLGVIFKVTTNGSYTALHMLVTADGTHPTGSLIMAGDGNLWGMAPSGGANSVGTIFKIALDGTFTRMHSMVSATEGSSPQGPLVQGTDGWLYGTAQFGGAGGKGTVFRISTSGIFQLVYSFLGSDGAFPSAGRLLEIQGGDSLIPDTNAPLVALTYPTNSSILSNTITLTATASDNIGIARVEFYRDTTTLLGSDSISPYTLSENTALTSNGSHTYTAKAIDLSGNSSTSSATVTVTNPLGQLLWVTNGTVSVVPGQPGVSRALAIASDATGNVASGGDFRYTLDFGIGLLTAGVPYDCFVVKHNSQGIPLWARRIGSSVVDSEAVRGVVFDGAGNLIVVGTFGGTNVDFGGVSLSTPTTPTGGSYLNIFVAKYTTSNDLIWVKRFGGFGNDGARCVSVDSSNNIFVGSSFQSTNIIFGITTLTNAGGSDIALSKLSGVDGTVLWAERFGGTDFDDPHGIAVNSSGDLLVAGLFGSSTINLGGGSITNHSSPGFSDGFVAKYSGVNGAYSWAKGFGTANNDYGNGVSVDPTSGNVIICGTLAAAFDFGTGLTPSGGIFLTTYSSVGTALWVKTFNTPVVPPSALDAGNAVSVDADGNIALIGDAAQSINFGAGFVNVGGVNSFAANYSSSGAYRWAKWSAATLGSHGYCNAIDPVGNILIGGSFSGTCNFGGISLTTPSPTISPFLEKYSK